MATQSSRSGRKRRAARSPAAGTGATGATGATGTARATARTDTPDQTDRNPAANGGALTIEDIAREAGVSRATVSLVLRESPLVATGTRERVRHTMERLRYRPNRMAASLRSRRSYILGLIVSDLTYPHYAQMASGVEEAVEGAGYSLIIANSHDAVARERRHVENLSRYSADGAIITPVNLQPEEVDHLRRLVQDGFPLVTLYREVPGLEADFCGSDVYGATRRLVAYLTGELGHREVALVTSQLKNSTNPARLAGWRDELRERGLPYDDGLVELTGGPNQRANGERAARALLARRRPTAVVCVNDLLALGVLRALHQLGIGVPGQVSVAGMSGFADLSPPQGLLTAVADDYRRLGREAGELLLHRIASPGATADGTNGTASPQRRIIPAELRLGETTAPTPQPS